MGNSSQIGLPERVAAMRGFDRASGAFDSADVVHSEARRRLLERLQLITLDPACVVDLGAATGKGSAELAAAFPQARVVAIDRSLPMLERTQARCADVGRVAALAGDAERLPLADNSADLIFANLILPWCAPESVFGEAARVLREGGLLSFTTVGPDTLAEVRRAWADIDDAIHVHGFIDMHDIGDLALRAGLTEPVMDVDTLQVTYRDLASLVADLRACGATNVAAGRRTTLTGRARLAAFREALHATRSAGRFEVTVELVFGQAWGGGAQRTNESGEAVISMEEMERLLKRD
jgi:malonyl-CoA O-methyltransferase